MNQTLRTILIAAAVFVVGIGLLFAGAALSRSFFWQANGNFGPGAMMGYRTDTDDGGFAYGSGGMMGGWSGRSGYYNHDDDDVHPFTNFGGMQGGMMGGWAGQEGCFNETDADDCPFSSGSFSGMPGGMMGSWSGGHGSFGYSGEDLPVLSLEEAQETLEAYVEALGIDNLEVEEIMIFSNHAYAEIVETDTGIGAFEVILDPLTGAVSPEPGPNMMWNLKYGMHAGGMMGGGMMGGFGPSGFNSADVDADLAVSEEQAVEIAQEFLDANYPGLQADEHADTFYGYYTLHTLEDGEIVGMLSVNGFSGDVFPHTWHGDFIEMTHEDSTGDDHDS